MNKKAAIIELADSHEECFYSQILFLNKAGYDVDVLCHTNLKDRTILLTTKANFIFYNFGKGLFNDLNILWQIRKYLIRNKIKKVVLNSADGIKVRNLLLFSYPVKIEFIGVLHDAEKVIMSVNQKFINKKVMKYLVLSDHVLEYINSLNLREKRFASFYPIFQPDYSSLKIQKPEDEFWVCIPGRVEQKRRDYKSLLNNLGKTSLSENIKIILLGKIDDKLNFELKSTLSKLNLDNQFILFENFISNEIFYSYLKMSDLVLPLIHPENVWFNKYSKTQISGSYNMAFTFRIPMMCEKSFSEYEDFKDTSFFYETENLITKINELVVNRDFFLSEKNKFYKLPKWNFEYQYKKYLDFIDS